MVGPPTRKDRLALALPRQDHQRNSTHHQERGQPGHAEISHPMKIKYSRYDCRNKEQKSD
jgi:hypothetical protein